MQYYTSTLPPEHISDCLLALRKKKLFPLSDLLGLNFELFPKQPFAGRISSKAFELYFFRRGPHIFNGAWTFKGVLLPTEEGGTATEVKVHLRLHFAFTAFAFLLVGLMVTLNPLGPGWPGLAITTIFPSIALWERSRFSSILKNQCLARPEQD